ncbi:MAG: PAS domain S-box protein [Rikenellaceae bacterium]
MENLVGNFNTLELINKSLLELGPDHKSNIKKLTTLCGELLGAFSVAYNRCTDNQLFTIGKYSLQPAFEDTDLSECLICKDVITDNAENATVIRNLSDSRYAENNSFIKDYDLKTYIGKPIRSEGELIGTFCLFFQNDFTPSDDNLRVLSIIGIFIGSEDKRTRDEEANEKSIVRKRVLLEASAKASHTLISNQNFDDAVSEVLGIIGNATDHDRIYICEFYRNLSTGVISANQRFEKIKGSISHQTLNRDDHNLALNQLLPKWYFLLSKGETIKGNVKDFSQDEREILEKQGIISLLAIPIFVDEVCWGFLGFDNCKEVYNWIDNELSILQNTTSALGLYLYRNRNRMELIAAKEQAEESEIYANALFEQSPLSIQYLNTNGLTEKVNKAFDSMFMISREKVVGKFNVLTDIRSVSQGWDKVLKRVLNGENEFLSDLTFDPKPFGYVGEKIYLNCISFPIKFKGRVKKIVMMYQDVTNLKKFEEKQKRQNKELTDIARALKESYRSLEIAKALSEEKEFKYKTILENSFNLIGQLSLEGKYLYYNRVYSDILGYDQNELLGTNGYALFHPDEFQRIQGTYFNQLMRNNAVKFSARVRTKSGEYKLIDHKFRLLKGEDKNEFTILLSAQDITDMNRNEMLLQMQRNLAYSIISCKNFNEFYSVIIDEINSIIPVNNLYVAFYDQKSGMLSLGGLKDEKDDIDIWPAEGSMTGYTIKQNKPVFVSKEEILKLCESGEIEQVGTMAEIWMGVPFTSESGITGAIVIQNYDNPYAFSQADIEIVELIANEIRIFIDKKNAEENALKLTKAVTESPASVIITDLSGAIEYVNPKFSSITGYSFDEVTGLNPRIFKSGNTPGSLYQNMWSTIKSGKEWRGELKNKKKNGEFHWEDISISPILDENGKISHYVAVKEDITDRKNLINQLIIARDKAEESDRLKTSFLQNISHEIRTPMNGIMGFIELLRDPDITVEEQSTYFDIIEKSSNRMLNTINDIIDISKIEAGVMMVKYSTVSVNQITSDIVCFFRPEVEKKGMKINLHLDQSVKNLTIISDMEKIYAALTNLIKNAVKYSIKGEINVGVIKKDQFVEFYVEDTGIGIPKENLDKIFERFIQAESESIRSHEGAGLGLSIVKAYIKLLGGKIHVESEPGVGSKFTFSIPLDNSKILPEAGTCNSAKNTSSLTFDHSSGSVRILIADDEETNAFYLNTILRQTNYNVLFAKNGKEAVDIFSENRDVKIILMDIRMPEMDGFQATKLIKNIEPSVIIIAQTAYAFAGDREKALEAGCDDYLPKPIKKDDLLEMLKKYLSV